MADIKRILNKKGWTGRELGILELTNMCVMFRNALEGKEPTPVVPPAQLQKMVSTITDRQQARTYNGYIAIHEWLRVSYNIAQTHEQQAQLQFRTLEGYMERAELAEQVYTYIAQLPAFMTQTQYDELKAQRLEAYLTRNGEGTYSNLLNLFAGAIHHFLRDLQKEPGKANPLKAIHKKYVSQPVKSKIIRSRYNRLVGAGYYTIEDGSGRRSDTMTPEEWQDAITTPAMRDALERMKETGGDEYTRRLAFDRTVERAKVIYRGGTEQDADKAQQQMDYERGLAVPVEWHYYEEPPAELTKWDIVEGELFEDLYPADLDGSGDAYSEGNFTASIEDLVAEFGELVTVILADIDKTFFKGKLSLADTPPAEWAAHRWSWRELYAMNFYSIRETAEADTTLFEDNPRAVYNGIAILRASDLTGTSPRIDSRGHYVEPHIRKTLQKFTLEAFFPEAEDYATESEIVENARRTLLESYYYIKGYNLALELIGEYYEVPEMTVFKMDLPALEEKIEALNCMIPLLYTDILNTDYADENLKQKKLQVLRDFFQPLEYKELEIPAQRIETAKELFKDFKAFVPDGGNFFNRLLCERPAGEDGEGA